MSLPAWLAAGWLQPHKTSSEEIRDLWQIVSRDLTDAASGGISADWQYGIAYNAALKLCTILLYAEGYKPTNGGMAHSRTLHALPHILGANRQGMRTILKDAARSETRSNTITPAAPRVAMPGS
jgi:hypothetical protein